MIVKHPVFAPKFPWQKPQQADRAKPGAPIKPKQQKSDAKTTLTSNDRKQRAGIKAQKQAQKAPSVTEKDAKSLAQARSIPAHSHARTISTAKNAGPRNRRPWEKTFFETLARCANVTVSARAAGINPNCVYDRRRTHPEFAIKMDEAVRQAVDLLEASAWSRATQGLERGVWSKDRNGDPIKVETVREYSDRLHEVLLRAHRPEKYSPKIQQELSGPGGAPLQMSPQAVSVSIILPDNGRGAIDIPAESSSIQFAPQAPALPTPAQHVTEAPVTAPQRPAQVESDQDRRARLESQRIDDANKQAMDRIKATHPNPPASLPFSGGTL